MVALRVASVTWSTPIAIYCPSGRARRFNELHARIPGISKKVLVQILRHLERDGSVQCTVYPAVPPRTEYRLTVLESRVHEPIAMLCRWITEHEAELEEIEARRRPSDGDQRSLGGGWRTRPMIGWEAVRETDRCGCGGRCILSRQSPLRCCDR